MKNRILGFKILIFLAVVFFAGTIFNFSFSAYAQNPYDYKQLEKIPGFEDSGSDLKSFVESIYKFGIWTVGIAAVLMITIGGFMYLTSAGNTSKMDVAKKVVTDAIIGLVVALGAYLILYVINPDLININIGMKQMGTSSGVGVGTTVSKTADTTATSSKTCKDGKCSQIDSAVSNNSYGVDAAILKSLIVGGEGCNNNHSSDGKSCGYGQVQYQYMRTVCGLSGSNEQLCSQMKSDITLDINCTAKFVKTNAIPCAKKVFGNTEAKSVGSCYNAGYTGKCGTNNYCQRVAAYYATCD